jgi:Tol biopolymer transport system component
MIYLIVDNVGASSPLLARTAVPITSISHGFLLVVIGVAIFTSSFFILLPASLPPNQSAYGGTFPGPNGQIAFVSDRDNPEGAEFDQLEIYVMNADGSRQTRLTDNEVHDRYPDWSPDGTKIAFARDNGTGFNEIYVMNADGSRQTRLTESVANDTSFSHSGDFEPTWSPDGTKIAFTSYRDATIASPNTEIYVMNADGSGITRLTDEFESDLQPSWSPDGTKIAFTSYRDNPGGQISEIYVMNADDGSDVTRLTHSDRFGLDPNWSPDGTKIAFTRGGDIYFMNADGSEPTRLTRDNEQGEERPSWSPDGTKIAFDSTTVEGHRNIYMVNADDGSNQTRLTNNESFEFSPEWGTNTSPAGGGNGDTISPVITVPQNITEEATSTEGAEVTYTVSAQDNVDGTATLEEDGTTVTQDDVGGDIDISCEPASGSVFPIGDTTVQCSATDAAGNTATESFTVTVNPPSPFPPLPTPVQAINELISIIENLDNVPQNVKTSLTTALNEVLNILSDDNPDNDESACGTLDALITQVNANERSDMLTADEADELRTEAEGIRNELDC